LHFYVPISQESALTRREALGADDKQLAQLAERLDALEVEYSKVVTRAQKLEDERAVLDVLCRYARGVDDRTVEPWIACFTDDAVFEIHTEDPKRLKVFEKLGSPVDFGARLVGRSDLLAFFDRLPPALQQHCFAESRVSIEGDVATVDSYLFVFEGLGERREVQSFGRYIDRLSRCADGQWRFTFRQVRMVSPS
jgi:hypothetical protein